MEAAEAKDETRICALLLDGVVVGNLKEPLKNFQATKPDEAPSGPSVARSHAGPHCVQVAPKSVLM